MIRAVRTLVVLTAGAAVGAVVVITHRVMQDTGKSLQEAIAEVPAEMEKLCAELKVKALDLMESGRAVYEEGTREPVESLAESGAGQQ